MRVDSELAGDSMTSSTELDESELILNPDGSVYHLRLRPQDLARKVILVGDPERVPIVSERFDEIELKVRNRAFATHTGYVGGTRLSVVSTGIGAGSIDIALNELDALVNLDLDGRRQKPEHTALQILRVGTAGSLQPDVALDSFVASSHAVGLDGLLLFYELPPPAEEDLRQTLIQHLELLELPQHPYVVSADPELHRVFVESAPPAGCHSGITVTCLGFYAPQDRFLRAPARRSGWLPQLAEFRYGSHRVTNFEMETADIYGLAAVLGHRACSLSAIVADRVGRKFSSQPAQTISKLIDLAVSKLVETA
ncbi:Uridine phosphorylase [Mycobacterium simulans]|nr:Uridine phosphorylase [Mycobacterium simulans]